MSPSLLQPGLERRWRVEVKCEPLVQSGSDMAPWMCCHAACAILDVRA